MTSFIRSIDESFAKTRIAKYFEVEERKTTLSIELRGALATFMSMAYILAVNPRIIADSGGPCIVPVDDPAGIFSEEYEQCLEEIKRQYITSTAIGSMIGCFIMGIGANLPIGLAPGMGMNAYFTYSVVGFRGTGKVSYDAALTAVLLEGFIFLILSVSGVRYAIVKLIPEPVRLATPAAIGAFLAHLGFQTAEGIGLVVANTATIVTLGGCPPEDRTYLAAFTPSCQADVTQCVPGDAYICAENTRMRSATTWLGLIGMMIMLIMLAYKMKSAFIVGIGFVTVVSWFRDTLVTYFPNTPAGDERFDFFTQVVAIEPVNKIFAQFGGNIGSAVGALVTFLYVDFLDTSGTLLAIVSNIGIVQENGDFPKAKQAFAADAIATMVGALFGLSPVTAYIESGAGVKAGSRTGITACAIGFLFFLGIFFAPIIASIPPWATGGALIITGALMSWSLGKIKWYDITHASTAFLTVLVMPLTYSIAYGLLAGICCYLIMNTVFYGLALIGIEKPVPEVNEFDEFTSSTPVAVDTESEDGSNKVKEDDSDSAKTEKGEKKPMNDDVAL